MNIVKIPASLPLEFFVKAEQLVDDTFGEGMFFKQTWDSSIHQWLALQSDNVGTIVAGYCSAQIKEDTGLGVLKTSVVNPFCRNMGIGDNMVKYRIKWLKDQNVKVIKSYAWFVDGKVPAQKMLMNNDFEPWGDVREYWSKDHNKGFPCVSCGDNCKCVARIFEYKG